MQVYQIYEIELIILNNQILGMDLGQQGIQPYVSPSFQTVIQKSKSNSKPHYQPTPRIFHSCVCHRAFIYIYGGLPLLKNQTFQNEHLFIYRYQIHGSEWKKIQTNFPTNISTLTSQTNLFQSIYSHSCAVYGNVMYLFGGKSGRNGVCGNQLWAMNLQSFNWRKHDQKGTIPGKRQSASLVLANKSNLFLYGGRNQQVIFNDIHIYKIQSKQWYYVQSNNCQFLMSKRSRPGITVINDVIYIFGGQRQSSTEQRSQLLDDFYQVKIIQKATTLKPDIWVKRISTLLNPGKANGAKLFACNDRYVGLIVGGLNQNQAAKLWLYDPQKIKWIYSKVQDPNKLNPGLGFSVLYQYDRVYLSSGVKKDLTPYNNLSSIYIDINQLSTAAATQLYGQVQNPRLCLLCQQQKHSLCRKKMNGFSLFQHSLRQMKYPFNSFGLLVDNSNLLKSTFINIQCLYVGKQKCLIIEDDGGCESVWNSQQEFLEDMIKFRTIAEQQMQIQGDQLLDNQQIQNHDQNIEVEESAKQKQKLPNTNNKQQVVLGSAKKQQEKEQERKLKKKKQLAKKNKARQQRKRKQFSLNLKMGAMRLAKKMMYVTFTADGSKRIFFMQQLKIHLIQEQQQSQSQGQIKYQCHYYFMPSQTSTVTSNFSSQTSRMFIQNQCKQFLKVIHENTAARNHLILIGLRDMTTEDGIKQPQLKVNTKMNDLYFGSNKLISKAQTLNIYLPDCIDVSLKSYLSMLYLKGEYAKISISTQTNKVEEISNALYFQKIDNLVKNNTIMDLEAAFDLQQCKIVQLYYHKNLLESGKKAPSKVDKRQRQSSSAGKQSSSNQTGVFLNGILIYHRNRLIKRYNHPFGSILKYSQLRKIVTKNYNPLKIFGFIQLDEVFYSNILKTNLVNQQNLNNMCARIKFVQQFLDSKQQTNETEQLSTKRSHRKLQGQDKEDTPQNKKKTKVD